MQIAEKLEAKMLKKHFTEMVRRAEKKDALIAEFTIKNAIVLDETKLDRNEVIAKIKNLTTETKLNFK